MTATTLPMSRFIQNYNQHLTMAEHTDAVIVLEQRGGRPAWVLETEHRVRATAQAIEFVATALTALVHDETLVDRFASSFAAAQPWVAFLPEGDRKQFAIETVETLRACASIGRFTAFSQLVKNWRNTAEIWSDPDLAAALSSEIGQPLDRPV